MTATGSTTAPILHVYICIKIRWQRQEHVFLGNLATQNPQLLHANVWRIQGRLIMVIDQQASGAAAQPVPTAAELYQAGYRARKTGKRTGEVIDPSGSIYRLNTRRETCTCRSGSADQGSSRCIHLRRYSGLRCEEHVHSSTESETREVTTT